MKIILLLLAIFITGCTKSMTNDEIIAEVKKCESAGMAYVEWSSLTTQGTSQIICTKRK